MTYRAFAHLSRFVLVSLGLVLSFSPRASADVAVVVPPHPEQDTTAEVLDQAVEELMRLLKVQGFDVISAGQAGPAAEAEQQRGGFPGDYDPLYCLTIVCADEYRKLFDATFAVQLSVASRFARPSTVSVVLTEGPRAFFAGTAPVEGRDVRAAVRTAFEAARQRQEEGAGPWLTVTGTPKGAIVYVDGSEYGRIPFAKRHLDPGFHRLEVHADGYAVEQRNLEVVAKIDHVENLEVTLTPTPARQPVASARPARRATWIHRSVWDWAVGGAIAAAGAAHLAAGIYQKARSGECAETASDGRCTQVYGDASGLARENLLIGFGTAGIALGALTIGLGPVGRLQLRSDRDSAYLQLRGEF